MIDWLANAGLSQVKCCRHWTLLARASLSVLSTLVLGLANSAALGGPSDVGAAAPAASRPPQQPIESTRLQLAQVGTPRSSTIIADPEEQIRRVRELIYLLRGLHVFERCDQWASAIRELAEIGKPAVPELIAELDRNERGQSISGLCFALRAIGDSRAVPALIRNIPKGLQPPGSDCGVRVGDPILMKFMLAHDNSTALRARDGKKDARGSFNFGRPVNEIFPTLEFLTGHREPEGANDPLCRVFLNKDVAKQAPQRQMFADRQKYWTEWWDQHQQEFVTIEELASLGPPRDNAAAIDAAGTARFGVLFPVGTDVRLKAVREVTLGLLSQWNAPSYIDLDNDRLFEYGEGWSFSPTRPFQDWHRQSGVDVGNMGTVEGVDLHLWLIDNQRWESIDDEVRSGKPLVLGPEASSMMIPFRGRKTDWVMGEIGMFLFTTREGGRGIAQVFPADKLTTDRRLRYRLWERKFPAPRSPLNKIFPETHAQFGDTFSVTLPIPAKGAKFLYDLDHRVALALPEDRDLKQFYSVLEEPETVAWVEAEGLDFAAMEMQWIQEAPADPKLPSSTVSLIGLQMQARQIQPDTFDSLTAEAADEVISRVVEEHSRPFYFGSDIVAGSDRPATYVFKTTGDRLGLLQVTTPPGPSDSITFRLRLQK